jgi:hypothetical protein
MTRRPPSPRRRSSPALASARRKAVAKETASPRAPARRADFGAPVDGFFSRQPANLRAILDALRALVLEAAPEATASIKWGMPFFAIDGEMMCALGAHRAHVNLILPGPPGTYADRGGRLEGEGKTGKHLALRALDELPRADVRRWLATAARRARELARG